MEVKHKANYRDGFKYCSNCGLWFKMDGRFCPKCRRRLRENPRNKKRGVGR
ncbi:MAG: hypothetical protein QXL31_07580 [Thermosphaera sp.]